MHACAAKNEGYALARLLNREETRRIEQILSRLSGEKICEVVSFKVQPSLRRFLREWGNPSAFARQAVVEKLRRIVNGE